MITVVIEHKYNLPSFDKITSSTKTVKFFGIVVWRKVHHYPKIEEYNVFWL